MPFPYGALLPPSPNVETILKGTFPLVLDTHQPHPSTEVARLPVTYADIVPTAPSLTFMRPSVDQAKSLTVPPDVDAHLAQKKHRRCFSYTTP